MADIRMEIIYYKIPSDYEMEFKFTVGYKYKARTLTCRTHTPSEFVAALSNAASRNRIVMVVGKLDGEFELCDLISKSIQLDLVAPNKEQYNISDESEVLIPSGSMPLVANGKVAGCLLENEAQTIILLTDDKKSRSTAMKELVLPYVTDITEQQKNKAVKTEEAVEENQNEIEQTAEEAELAVALQEPEEIVKEVEETIDETEPEIKDSTEPLQEEVEISSKSQEVENDDNFILDVTYEKKPKNKKPLKVLLSLVIALVILTAGCFSYFKFYMPIRAEKIYTKASQLLGKGDQSLPESALTKFGKLYNNDAAFSGWLSIGGTNISLPVMSSANKINGYYNEHLYNGEYNLCGTPYITKVYTNESYFRNIVIYTNSGFVGNQYKDLSKYSNLDFYKSAPIITFDSLYSENTWKIFSIFEFSGNKPIDYEKDVFFDDAEFAEHVNGLAAVSNIVTTVPLSNNDEILTLVNQSEQKTIVIVARKTYFQEDVAVDVDGAVYSKNHSGQTGIGAFTQSSSSEIVSSNPIQEIVSSNTSSTSSNKPVVSKKPVVKVENEDEPLSQDEINQNLQNIIKPPVVSSKPTPSSQPKPTTPSSKPTPSSAPSTPTTPPAQNAWLPLTATRNSDGAKLSGTAIEIIAQICAAEMGSSYEPEALKAQAIAAYNWMLCNGGASGKYPRVPMKTANQKIIDAVTAVAGKCIYYNGQIAQTYYYAYSAGVTSNSYDYWSATVIPYLTSVDSSVDKNHKNFQTLTTIKASDVASKVLSKLDINLNGVADKTKWFNLTYCDNGTSPYVKNVTFGNDKTAYKGKDLRGLFSLKSSAITITYNKDNDTFTFTTKGFGHGIGMSQYGANQYALKGWKYEQILAHYYRGTNVK